MYICKCFPWNQREYGETLDWYFIIKKINSNDVKQCLFNYNINRRNGNT